MKGYLRYPMINDDRGVIDSAIVCGDESFLFTEEGELDFISGMSYYVRDPSIHCRFVE